MTDQELESVARSIIEANLYMTLATADESGRPWASPVYYAFAGDGELFWVSSPDATHSRNLERRPELGIVIFDSTVAIDTGRGVYMPAVAQQVTETDVDRGIGIFSSRSREHGGSVWTRETCSRPPRCASTARPCPSIRSTARSTRARRCS